MCCYCRNSSVDQHLIFSRPVDMSGSSYIWTLAFHAACVSTTRRGAVCSARCSGLSSKSPTCPFTSHHVPRAPSMCGYVVFSPAPAECRTPSRVRVGATRQICFTPDAVASSTSGPFTQRKTIRITLELELWMTPQTRAQRTRTYASCHSGLRSCQKSRGLATTKRVIWECPFVR